MHVIEVCRSLASSLTILGPRGWDSVRPRGNSIVRRIWKHRWISVDIDDQNALVHCRNERASTVINVQLATQK